MSISESGSKRLKKKGAPKGPIFPAVCPLFEGNSPADEQVRSESIRRQTSYVYAFSGRHRAGPCPVALLQPDML